VLLVAKIKIDDSLFDRVKKVAEVAGYSSPEEFIVHMIEKELGKIETSDDDQAVIDRLKGLGYLE
jgi:metal-responsive CopG/Arc/MetJ family transcriptional regulator